MRKKLLGSFIICFFILGFLGAASAIPVTSTTDDLGNNIIYHDGSHAGSFQVILDADTPSEIETSSLYIKYGLWNSPEVTIDTYFNGYYVGNFLAYYGYVSPGPSYISFDITGLLLNGSNTISFNGSNTLWGDYVIGRVDMNYDNSGTNSVPEPFSVLLLGSGLIGLVLVKRKI
jgi:hypothetical protein